jgi:hypothetical protein
LRFPQHPGGWAGMSTRTQRWARQRQAGADKMQEAFAGDATYIIPRRGLSGIR